MPPIACGKLTHHPKAKAEAASRTAGDQAFELFEDASLVVGGDAEAMISDLKANLAGVACQRHIDWFAVAVFDGVGYQVLGDFLDGRAVEEADDILLDGNCERADPAASA